MPPVIYSSGQNLRLVFRTDYSLEYTGFRISYSSINSSEFGLYFYQQRKMDTLILDSNNSIKGTDQGHILFNNNTRLIC